MSALAPTLEAFFTERLITQRRASSHTIAAYRDAICLLLGFVERRTGKAPATLQFEDLDAATIGRFLDHLERERGNSVRTRNARLSAIHSLFRYAALRHPEHAELMRRVLAIPPKRSLRTIVTFLTDEEVEAILAAPDRRTFLGRRDHALLLLAIQTGLRVSELTRLVCEDIALRAGAHVRCVGKGRKQRATPLTTTTAAVLQAWIKERGGQPTDPLFPTRHGAALSRWGVSLLVSRHAHTAARRCPSLATKKVSPHVLRHTAAMRLLHAGVDTSVIALWLGHESVETTQIYVHADLTLKERALARTSPAGSVPRRYRPRDELLAFLEAL
ncbi:MAG: tyrosine-type recombinase/integrase [Gemmatimonadales bacterium]|jgi:site-specific recombinase XerD